MIAREKRDLAAPDEIASRISHVSDGGAIVSQGANHDRAGHGSSARSRRSPRVEDAHVRSLHKAIEQCAMWFACSRFAKTCANALHGCLGGYFAEIVPANPVCQDKKPPLRTGLLG